MKRALILAALLALAACAQAPQEPRVMARHVPERADDFVFENNLVCGRIYGKALEGNPTSPGVDIWVKLPGTLVANEWYRHFSEEGNESYYHHDHGGKDCYKVAVSLGGGASALLVENRIQYPATNWRSYEILEEGPEKVAFVLHYPEWQAEGVTIALDKKITVTPDTYFFKCEDTYTFNGEGADSLWMVAGINRHAALETIETEWNSNDRYAIWEHASDQSNEPEDGMIGVAVYMPEAETAGMSKGDEHAIVGRQIVSGQTVTYYFGSCWSKGDIKSSNDWFELVKSL